MDGQEKRLRDVLSDEHLLREWVYLSLDDRCKLIKEKFGVQLTRFTLAKIYQEMNIIYSKTKQTFFSNRTVEEHVNLLVEYIGKLKSLIRKNKEIIYIDETSTNLWEKRAKIWQTKDKSLPMVI